MTLDEAIKHCEEKIDCTECGQEHKQLAEWLKYYKILLKRGGVMEVNEEDYTVLTPIHAKTEKEKNDASWFMCVVEKCVNLYVEKNRRYGDSFSNQYKDFGNMSVALRLTDKVERLKSLVKRPDDYGDEPIEDTLTDIANYAIMALIELNRNKKEE